jgi:Sulfotransferase family
MPDPVLSPEESRQQAPAMSPVFVFGVDHSGTTILYRMLAYHPDLTWFSQFSLRDGQIPGRSRRPGAGRLDPLLRFRPHAWHKEEAPRLSRLLVPRPDVDERLWNHLLEDDASAAGRVRACLSALSERHGGRRVLAKRPAFDRYLGVLRSAFPAARFVQIVRDGRPVALSGRAKIVAGQSENGERVDPEDALLTAARHWVDVLERAERTPGIDLLEIRYEDFCEDVHGTIRAILEHADLDPETFPFRRCPRTLENRNMRWLEAASSKELDSIARVQRERLARYGYVA